MKINVDGQWHELPADTPPEKVTEYVKAVQEMVGVWTLLIKKANGKNHLTMLDAVKYLSGE